MFRSCFYLYDMTLEAAKKWSAPGSVFGEAGDKYRITKVIFPVENARELPPGTSYFNNRDWRVTIEYELVKPEPAKE